MVLTCSPVPKFHSEPYIQLSAVTHKAVLISWGAFYFRVKGEKGTFKLVDDQDLDRIQPSRTSSIGARSDHYAKTAQVDVMDLAGNHVASGVSFETNHCWVPGLHPDTEYRYRVVLNGEEWAGGSRRDWIIGPLESGLAEVNRTYDNRFRTLPDPLLPATELTFAVLGDFGVGILKNSDHEKQQAVAEALERGVDEFDIRLLITTGDNIYSKKHFGAFTVGSGKEDDDWFFTYYQPYRYIINRIPVYPCIGNHDADETEDGDDRGQLYDNFYINERFAGEEASGRASLNPGTFYRFRYGSDIEFICLDSSKEDLLSRRRLFDHPRHRQFLDLALSAPGAGSPRWRIPFLHHPPFCAGPRYGNTKHMEGLLQRFETAGVRAVFSGHEHNFQHSVTNGVHYFVSGSGAKIRADYPSDFMKANTVSWCTDFHFLVVTIRDGQMSVRPFGILKDGKLVEIERRDPANASHNIPIDIRL
jgi:tartrate-resistant acid phosphatase type 5